jgi:hypothetical protein
LLIVESFLVLVASLGAKILPFQCGVPCRFCKSFREF